MPTKCLIFRSSIKKKSKLQYPYRYPQKHQVAERGAMQLQLSASRAVAMIAGQFRCTAAQYGQACCCYLVRESVADGLWSFPVVAFSPAGSSRFSGLHNAHRGESAPVT